MAATALNNLLRRLRDTSAAKAAAGLPDTELLERWATRRDEAAFEVLVWRHGPMVLGLSRRLLPRAQDIEDAFQATFLALVRKANAIRRPEAVGSWLYKVAYRVALRSRAGAVKRAAREEPAVDMSGIESRPLPFEQGLAEVLDEEVSRLPAKYRAALVLCYVEGRTNREAARELGCPVGTVFSRLASARQLLQRRLARRGVALSIGLLVASLGRETASATMSPALAKVALSAGRWTGPATGTVPNGVVALTDGVLRAMSLSRLRVVAALGLVLALFGAGLGTLAHGLAAPGSPDDPRPTANRPASGEPGRRGRMCELASQRDGVVLVVGTEVKPGSDVPLDRLVTVEVGGESKRFRRLQVGDIVEDGQLLAQLDDGRVRTEAASRQARVAVSEADLGVATSARLEAAHRYENNLKLRGAGKISEEELQGAKLTRDRFAFEVAEKEQQSAITKLQCQQAQTVVDMYQVRSRARGVIRAIYRQPGEAVRALEPLFRIELLSNDERPAAGKAERPYDAPSRESGIICVIGTELNPGEKVAAERLVKIRCGAEVKTYRRLQEGDRVEAGQLLAQLDDRLARGEVAIHSALRKARLADLEASTKTCDEARRRYETMFNALRKTPLEEVRVARLVWERYANEVRAKQAQVRVAELDLKQAEQVLEAHQVRSAVQGVIKAIYKQPGEGVKHLEPVFRIEPSPTIR
jgi:RNA polymerase sigma factor (sigma-70 family)